MIDSNQIYISDKKNKFCKITNNLDNMIDNGTDLLDELAKRNEQLYKISINITGVNRTLDISGFILRGLTSFYGHVVNSFTNIHPNSYNNNLRKIVTHTVDISTSDTDELDRILSLAKRVHNISQIISVELNNQNDIIQYLDTHIVSTNKRLKKQINAIEQLI